MVDAEVLRLRKLRNVALRTRALGKALDSKLDDTASVFARGSVLCWTVARIASGRLRAHPYPSYQKGHSASAALSDAAIAAAFAAVAHRQNRELDLFAEQLQAVASEIDDVRSLTLYPNLSDALGRMQVQMRALTGELASSLPAGRLDRAVDQRLPRRELAVDESWPYLAI